jgi:hypothetical protein
LRKGKKASKNEQSNSIFDRFPLNIFRGGGRSTAQEVETFFYPPKDSTNGDGLAVADEGEDVHHGETLRHGGGKTVIEDSQSVTNSWEVGNDGRDEPEVEAEEAVEQTPPTPANLRKRAIDIFEVDEAHSRHLEEGREIEEPARKPSKRPRGIKKAKPPIVLGKARQSATNQRQTRANTRAADNELQSETASRRTNSAVMEIAGKAAEPISKRSRGRPPKAKVHEPEVVVERLVDDGGEIEDVEEGPERSEHGVSEILMSQSPIKSIIPTPQKLKWNPRLSRSQPNPSESAPSAQGLKHSSMLDDEEDDPENEEEDDPDNEEEVVINEPASNSLDDDGQSLALPSTLKDIISIEPLEEMLETVQRVGQKQDRSTKEWDVVRTRDNPCSVPGKRMMRKLRALIETYAALPALKAAESEFANVNQALAAETIENLLEEAEVIFRERLGSKAHGIPQPDIVPTRKMLTDIYFLLIPNLVKVLKLAVEAYYDEDLSNEDPMIQVVQVLSLLRKLGERALQQPPDIQLKGKGYRISRPTSSVIQHIRLLSKNLRIELNRREQNKSVEAWNAGAPERERQREAEEQRKKIQRRREENRIIRKQQEVLDMRSNDPLYQYYVRFEIERTKAKGVGMQAARPFRPSQFRASQSPLVHGSDVDVEMQDDPFADAYKSIRVEVERDKAKRAGGQTARSSQPSQYRSLQGSLDQGSDAGGELQDGHFGDGYERARVDKYERIKIFGNKKANKHRGLTPLSRREMDIFVRTMKWRKGNVPLC